MEEMALFGSVLREDFNEDSDVDVLVFFQEKPSWSLFDLIDLQEELQNLFSRPVDIVQKKELNNPYRRQEILKTHQLVYGQK
ncbi:nucleotidyltransferase family protein [Halothece sp. PCC 7418]|uniref:nucleotidyltransferase family protein n=1 Tax=Halothece sp. (strain PCC 7418) TaxID=65093 RepID=UPI00210103FF|nr:nucleotidyltransferase domain-containing protein [Halothece sp. PCC 7418]